MNYQVRSEIFLSLSPLLPFSLSLFFFLFSPFPRNVLIFIRHLEYDVRGESCVGRNGDYARVTSNRNYSDCTENLLVEEFVLTDK